LTNLDERGLDCTFKYGRIRWSIREDIGRNCNLKKFFKRVSEAQKIIKKVEKKITQED
jgi:hypothetical protein